MLGRRPSGGGWGLSTNCSEPSSAFEPPRQQPPAGIFTEVPYRTAEDAENRLPSSVEEGMLGRRPSGGGSGLSTKAVGAVNSVRTTRQQPPAAVCPSLSK